jgi:hypothetical protein
VRQLCRVRAQPTLMSDRRETEPPPGRLAPRILPRPAGAPEAAPGPLPGPHDIRVAVARRFYVIVGIRRMPESRSPQSGVARADRAAWRSPCSRKARDRGSSSTRVATAAEEPPEPGQDNSLPVVPPSARTIPCGGSLRCRQLAPSTIARSRAAGGRTAGSRHAKDDRRARRGGVRHRGDPRGHGTGPGGERHPRHQRSAASARRTAARSARRSPTSACRSTRETAPSPA